MTSMLVAMLVACAPSPASIKLDGDATVSVHTMDPIAVQGASVLDDAGNAIDPAPELTWTVTPDTVAKLEGGNVVPVANGEATVTAAVGEVKAEYKVMVAIPDAIAVAGYAAGDAFGVGETKQLTATLEAGGNPVEGMAVTWASDNAAIATVDDKGMVTGVAEGAANVTATSGALTSTVAITIGPAAPAVAGK